jgi:hypothetical protein
MPRRPLRVEGAPLRLAGAGSSHRHSVRARPRRIWPRPPRPQRRPLLVVGHLLISEQRLEIASAAQLRHHLDRLVFEVGRKLPAQRVEPEPRRPHPAQRPEGAVEQGRR